MLRGYRRIILAALAGLALSGAHPKPSAGGEKAQTNSGVDNALTNLSATNGDQTERTKSPPQSPPCGPRQYQRNDDLCAQWKAADAAADAAGWAALGTWFSGLSILGVVAAIGLAFHSNWIARDAARRQLRAYLVIPWAVTAPLSTTSAKWGAKIAILNKGQTPAYDVKMVISWIMGDAELKDPPLPDGEIIRLGILGQTANDEHPVFGQRPFGDRSALVNLPTAHLKKPDYGLHVYGRIDYLDCFGDERYTTFQFFTDWYAGEEKGMMMAYHGNEAT